VLDAVGAEGRWLGLEVPFDRKARAARIVHDLSDPTTFAGFVADDAGRVVGSIDLRLAPYGVVSFGMAILEAYRSQGIGTRLVPPDLRQGPSRSLRPRRRVRRWSSRPRLGNSAGHAAILGLGPADTMQVDGEPRSEDPFDLDKEAVVRAPVALLPGVRENFDHRSVDAQLKAIRASLERDVVGDSSAAPLATVSQPGRVRSPATRQYEPIERSTHRRPDRR